MLAIARPVKGIVSRILDPVAERIVRSMVNALGLSDLFGDEFHARDEHFKNAHTSTENHKPDLGFGNRVIFTKQLSIAPQDNTWTSSFNLEEEDGAMSGPFLNGVCPIMYEPLMDIRVIEYSQPNTLAIDCTLQFESRETAYQALELVYYHLDPDQARFLIDLDYDYIMPTGVTAALFGLYKTALMNDPTTNFDANMFVPWLRKHSKNQIGLLIQREKPTVNRQYIVHRQYKQIPVITQCSQSAPVMRNAYEFTLSFKAQFTMPVTLFCTYPIIVRNQLVPETLIGVAPTERYSEDPANSPFFAEDRYRQLLQTTAYDNPIKPVKLPWYDNWLPPKSSPIVKRRFHPILTSAILLDNVNVAGGTTDFNLGEIGEVGLLAEILEELQETYDTLQEFTGLYHVAIYADNHMVHPDLVTIDADLNITLASKDISKVYRLVVAVNTRDFSELRNVSLRAFMFNVSVATAQG